MKYLRNITKPSFFWILTFCLVFLILLHRGDVVYANNNRHDELPQSASYHSPSWNKTMNQPGEQREKYPAKRKINPETVRLTLNEYYIPQISELLNKGVDYYEWLNQLDDPYLNRYKVDMKVDPDDERLKLFWKSQF